MLRTTLLLGLSLAVCNSPASETGDSPAPTAQQSADPSPEWDRPMPFVDQGWFCERRSEPCVWSEEAVGYARWLWVDEVHPPTAFCFSGVFSNDLDDFRRCGRTLDFCNLVRSDDPKVDQAKPCREMTPTEFWRENPMLVEVHRKICNPQKCRSGYRWVGAAKVKGETLPIDEAVFTDLGDGVGLTTPSEPNWPGVLLHEDRDCAYGCVLRRCRQDQYGCIDSTSHCDLCFDEEPLPADECRRFVETCREVTLVEEAADFVCVFKDVVGESVEERHGCPSSYSCERLYDEDAPADVRLRGVCRRRSAD